MKKKKRCCSDMEELRQEMYLVGQSLKVAYERFDLADDPDLIEASIFEINSFMAQYNYLLRRIKAQSGVPVQRVHAFPVAKEEAQATPCVAAANVKGGNICHS